SRSFILSFKISICIARNCTDLLPTPQEEVVVYRLRFLLVSDACLGSFGHPACRTVRVRPPSVAEGSDHADVRPPREASRRPAEGMPGRSHRPHFAGAASRQRSRHRAGKTPIMENFPARDSFTRVGSVEANTVTHRPFGYGDV